jgi:ubiquinol-cytochrome c reductase cytochrome c subunit
VRGAALLVLAALGFGAAIFALTAPTGSAQEQGSTLTFTASEQDALVGEGRQLFLDGCVSCHGFDAEGVPGVGPSLVDVGAQSADFYLSTGRMPFKEETGEEPVRSDPAYSPDQIRALVAYVGSLGGPGIPAVNPEQGELNEGLRAYTVYCAGCHQVVGQGGVVTGAIPPALQDATAVQIAEAVRIGPYVMPAFDETTIDDRTLDSIIRYVELTKDPADPGGWGIGHIGPIPEGLVAWLMGLAALVAVVRIIGERAE